MIHTIALRAISLDTGLKRASSSVKTRSGKQRVEPVNVCTVNESVVIKITDTTVGNVDKKHAGDVNTCLHTDFAMLFMTFAEAVAFTIKFIDDYGGTFATHCLHNDLGFLKCTQDHVGGRRVIKKAIQTSPKTGMYNKKWEEFTLVCTMTQLCTKCPRFMKSYQQSCPQTTLSGKYASMQLENLSRFVKGDPLYVQGHSAAQDVIDLCEVLEAAHAYDGPKMFDGYDCVNWNVYDTLPKVAPVVPATPVSEPPTLKQQETFTSLYNRKRDKISSELEAAICEKPLSKASVSKFIGILLQL